MRGAFTEHVLEAIALNRERMPLYAAASGGRSLPISRRLILYEHLTRPLAWYVDRRARRHEAAGVPLVSEAFVSMSLVPAFVARMDPPPPPPTRPPVDPGVVSRAAWGAYRQSGFEAAAAELEPALRALAQVPDYYCMLRHLVESSLRIARLAPVHAAMSVERQVPNSAGLSWLMLWNHLLAFPGGARLDRRAMPLQAEGIPILTRDLPPIAIPASA